jgi:hypothetical protein
MDATDCECFPQVSLTSCTSGPLDGTQRQAVGTRTGPVARHTYRSGHSVASADRTVFLEIPATRVISEIHTPLPDVAGGSRPHAPRPTPASFLARFKPEFRGSWSTFSCRTVISNGC